MKLAASPPFWSTGQLGQTVTLRLSRACALRFTLTGISRLFGLDRSALQPTWLWPRQGSNPGPTGFEAKRLSRPVSREPTPLISGNLLPALPSGRSSYYHHHVLHVALPYVQTSYAGLWPHQSRLCVALLWLSFFPGAKTLPTRSIRGVCLPVPEQYARMGSVHYCCCCTVFLYEVSKVSKGTAMLPASLPSSKP